MQRAFAAYQHRQVPSQRGACALNDKLTAGGAEVIRLSARPQKACASSAVAEGVTGTLPQSIRCRDG
jgi:hypothetical protein